MGDAMLNKQLKEWQQTIIEQLDRQEQAIAELKRQAQQQPTVQQEPTPEPEQKSTKKKKASA